MVTDKQYQELSKKCEELERKYAQMSRDIASIKMALDIKKTRKAETQMPARKDITRYHFDGKQTNKRHLVLNCIKKYIQDSGIHDAEKLLEIFPDYIQGPLGVIRAVEDAEKYSSPEDRYFFADNDVLRLQTGIFVISKDWTVNNIGKFIEVMETLGYEIKPISR